MLPLGGVARTGAETITCSTDVKVLRLTSSTFLTLRRQQDHKEAILRGVRQARVERMTPSTSHQLLLEPLPHTTSCSSSLR